MPWQPSIPPPAGDTEDDPSGTTGHGGATRQLWAPWRMSYLEDESAGPAGGCFLCALGIAVHEDKTGIQDGIVVWRGDHVYALLNAYPYANGHVMVAPYVHEGALDALDEQTAVELIGGVRLIIAALRRTYHPQGFNVGANLGSAAGAGFGDHMHWHVVPRWQGDTNFMTTVGGTRVIPESLDETARRLRQAVAEVRATTSVDNSVGGRAGVRRSSS